MNFELFLARKISYQSGKSFSRIIIRIAIAAIALSVATMIISDCVITGFQDEIKNKISGFASHIQLGNALSNQSFENKPILRDKKIINVLLTNPEVKSFQAYATKPAILKTTEDIEGVVLKGVENDYNWKIFSDNLKGGNIPKFSITDIDNQCIISKYLADKMRLKVGDIATFFFVQQPPKVRQLKISGIYETSVEEVDKLFVICDLKQIQRLNEWKSNEIGGLEIFVKDFNKLEDTNEKIRLLTELIQDTRTVKERYPQIFDWLNLLNDNIKIILTLMGAVAIINMVTALLIMIFEKSTTIGLLKALGATDWKVERIFIYNSIGIVFLGLLFGNIFGLGIMYIQSKTHLMTLNPESYYLATVPVSFNQLHLILINIGGLIFCSAATILPSGLVLRIKPAKALRFE